MKPLVFRSLKYLVLIHYLLIFSSYAHATLGEPAHSIEIDRNKMSAVLKNTERKNEYSVQEIASESLTVREYINPNGIVFGFAWNGTSHPDLTQLLGSYSKDYQNSQKNTHKRYKKRGSQMIKTDRLILSRWGQMRNLSGRAYDPSLIPSGVTPDEIK